MRAPSGSAPRSRRSAWTRGAVRAAVCCRLVSRPAPAPPPVASGDDPLLAPLNDAQRAAVRHLSGPALVVAGAGSGKTRTVVHRIAYLLRTHEVLPQQVLAVTFTNKAASELKERVLELIGPRRATSGWPPSTGRACACCAPSVTASAWCPASRSTTTATSSTCSRSCCAPCAAWRRRTRAPCAARSTAPSRTCGRPNASSTRRRRAYGRDVGGLPIELVAEVFGRYEARLRQSNAVDFNDILGRTVQLFGEAPDVLDLVQQRAVFIHVDEYQDTNPAQYELTRLLADKYRNLMAVGDPDQGIYSFRSADIRNILDFQRDLRGRQRLPPRAELPQRRQRPAHRQRADQHNVGRLEKDLRATRGEGDPVRLYRANDHRAEADFVARTVERVRGEGVRLSDCAVLYRTNAQSRVLEESLRRAGLSAVIVGGVGFYERREVKDALAYARAALNAADDVAWRRVLNRPKRGIGQTSEQGLAAYAQRHGLRFADALRAAPEALKGTPAVGRIADFVALMDDLAEAADTLAASQFLKAVLDQSGYLQALKDEGGHESLARLENLDELVSAVSEWEAEGGGSIAEFLDEAALMTSVDDRAIEAVNDEVPDDAVTLMTLHNAKGLEFPVVFLVGLEEQLLPHRSSTGSLQEIEEERRLLYVGITRAQEQLYLVHCASRMTFGRTEFARPSRFLEDLPKGALVEIDVLGQVLDAPAPGRSAAARSTWVAPSAPTPPPGGGAALTYRGGERVKHPSSVPAPWSASAARAPARRSRWCSRRPGRSGCW
jgi:DNA helicase II / ATP-dependent DNA helicase PcrA